MTVQRELVTSDSRRKSHREDQSTKRARKGNVENWKKGEIKEQRNKLA